MCACWAPYSFPNLKLRLDTNALISFSTLISMQYFLCISEITENPASQRYDVLDRKGVRMKSESRSCLELTQEAKLLSPGGGALP